MPWQAIVFLRVCNYLISPALQKKLTGLPGRPQRLMAQFGFATMISVLVFIAAGGWRAEVPLVTLLLITGMGLINGFAAYAQWRAIDLSLSQTSLFSQADDLIALVLGITLLGESHYLQPFLTVGVLLCLGGALAYTLSKTNGQRGAMERRSFFRLLAWVGIYSVIWGVAIFSFRYFALAGVPIVTYALCWYTGALLGSFLVMFLVSTAERGAQISWASVARVSPLATLVWGSLMLAYWANQKAPIVIVQPIYQVAEMVLPTLVGLYLFKEGRDLSRSHKFLFFVGLCGVAILFFA
ncbi:MAG: hypothetical protein Q7R83_00460 [bacterium]|nr:hypothetical protein [bacterium]